MGSILPSLCVLVALLPPAARATFGAFPLALDPRRSSPGGEEERLEPPHLTLPVYLHSRSPLVPKQRFSPAHARARLQRVPVPVPERVRRLLLPAPRRPLKSRRVRGGAVRVACSPTEMRVRVQTESVRVKLGTCGASGSTEQFVMFQYDLQQCGTHRQVINGTVIYSNTLHYVPDESSSEFFSIPVQCHFNRFHYSYKIGFVPHVETVRFFKPIRTKGSVSLSACDGRSSSGQSRSFSENWNKLPPLQGFVIGHPVFLEAEVPLVSEGERLHADFCHITTKSSRLSLPRLDIIHNYGCMIYSNGSQWRFMKSDRRNVVRFSIDAFTLQEQEKEHEKHLFLHCEMSVRDATTTPTSKFCTYNQQERRWEELYGSDSVCSCCDSSCLSETPEVLDQSVTSKSWSVVDKSEQIRLETEHGSTSPGCVPDQIPAETEQTVITHEPGTIMTESKHVTATPAVQHGIVSTASEPGTTTPQSLYLKIPPENENGAIGALNMFRTYTQEHKNDTITPQTQHTDQKHRVTERLRVFEEVFGLS